MDLCKYAGTRLPASDPYSTGRRRHLISIKFHGRLGRSAPAQAVPRRQGASLAGFSLYAKDGKLHLVRNGWADESLEDTLPATITTPSTVHVAAYPGGRVRWEITGEKPRDCVTSKPSGGKGFRKNPTQPLAAGLVTETPVGSYPKNFKYQGTLGPVLVETISQKKERPKP